jgi:hypothetical protein
MVKKHTYAILKFSQAHSQPVIFATFTGYKMKRNVNSSGLVELGEF